MNISETTLRDQRQEAIVIGGGIAGLLSAHVLSEFVRHVTLIERDSYPDQPEFRPGTPQGRHPHTCMSKGLQVIEGFFPGFWERIVERGAQPVDFTRDIWTRLPSGWLPREKSARLRTVICTRALIEWQMRQEIARNPGVHVLQKREAAGLLLSTDRRRVRGVRIRVRGQAESGTDQAAEIVPGELVVDASGRDSRMPLWLAEWHHAVPHETIVNSYLGYATRLYLPPPGALPEWKGVYIQPAPPHNLRSGIICPIENGTWLVLLTGAGKDYPPTDCEQYLEFARGLPDPLIYEALQGAQPLSPAYGYRRTENRLRHYERLQQMPEGLFVLGDAACALNPLYGQGMSAAALGVTLLRNLLRRQGTGAQSGLSLRFQRELARLNAHPWQLAISADAQIPLATGIQAGGITRFLINHLVRIAPTNTFARQRFMEVIHLLRPPSALLHPLILLAILRNRRRRDS